MSEFNESNELDLADPLLSQLNAMRPAEVEGLESRVMYSAGRADAIREFSVRANRRVWLNAAAMLLIAAGSSALTWNFSGRAFQNNNGIASNEQPANNAIAVVSDETSSRKHEPPVAVAQNNSVPSTAKTLNQLVDELLKLRGHEISTPWDLPGMFSSDTSTQPVSTGPRTWLQLQRELLNESSAF